MPEIARDILVAAVEPAPSAGRESVVIDGWMGSLIGRACALGKELLGVPSAWVQDSEAEVGSHFGMQVGGLSRAFAGDRGRLNA